MTMRIAAFFNSKVYRPRSVYLFFALCALIIASSAQAEERYLDALLKSAHEKKLAEDRVWEVLVHYKHRGAGTTSLIDDPRFFLAPKGKTDPSAELDATLTAFFREDLRDVEHPRCRFVARYAWLKEQLDIDEDQLPAVACTEFRQAIERVNVDSAVLVFPASLNNSPASMFGHTLIRIDSANQNDLLSYAVTYAANATDSNGFLYAFKGIFGYYRGYFSILPYYDKVAEYSNIEHRDIWEYQLNLTRDEVTRMVMHVWEVRDIYSDYYFFDENCSFDLLLLLETARPSLHLSDDIRNNLHFWVIPVDTIRAIKEAGLVRRERYRPSLSTRIAAIAAPLDGEQRKTAMDVANGTTPARQVLDLPESPAVRINILDLSAELMQYRYARKELEKEAYLKLFLPALNARSTLGKHDGDAYAVSTPPPPEQGHLPGKISIDAGYRTDSAFLELGWRAAYHDQFDPEGGFVEGAQIDFLNLRARYLPDQNSLKLWQFRLIDITSLSPRTLFFSPVSWKVNTGFDRKVLSDGEDHLIYRLNAGGGFATKNQTLGLSYILIESDLNLSGSFKQNYSLGFGPSAGIINTIGDAWKINLFGSALYYEAGDEHRSLKATLIQSFRINAENSITVSLSREKTFNFYRTDVSAGWNVYLR